MPFPRFRTFADLTEPEPPQITGDFAPEGLDPSAWDYIKRGGIQTLGRAGDILSGTSQAPALRTLTDLDPESGLRADLSG